MFVDIHVAICMSTIICCTEMRNVKSDYAKVYINKHNISLKIIFVDVHFGSL